ncbi:hypothetical protein C5167_048145 [Papaver somniferum]|uniref:Uncharacterized protein n=1 Tax=Papaver somniferum TaxID=3469 RepID=A0A4Y7KIH5_PAPSO|nr:uncharacterized protein LOC113304478 [Papaver somniferum]RZC72666.1 hypothetical protein C5167_048145 [Papaver somniferum]
MAKISSSSILFLIGFLLLVITVFPATDKSTPTPSGNAPDGSECPMRDAANSKGTSRIVDGLSCDGCTKSCFKKCGKSKTKTLLACRQMTSTKWSCGCCCSKD